MPDRPPGARANQRRQVTVLFADISGFTAMSERLDPEDVTTIMNACFAMVERIVRKHGGTIDKYIGDAVMALFGAAHALENAPRHAVTAALEIRSALETFNREHRLPVPLEVHIGVNSGLVFAGEVGGEMKRDFTVMGDTVNLASRLESASEMGQIFVGATTESATRDAFTYRKLKPLSLKGKEEPVQAFEVIGAKHQAPVPKLAASTRQISSELVGREVELGRLRERITRLTEGEGGIVSIVGDAGIGKSRLLAEVANAPELEGTTIVVGRSDSVGTGLSYHPFVGLLRDWAAIKDTDLDDVSAKLLDAIRDVLGQGASEVFPFIATLMGLRVTADAAQRVEGVDSEAMEKLILKAMNDLLIGLAMQRPLVLLFEDLHWADLSSIKLLDALLRLCVEHRILFILAYRPSFAETSDRIATAARSRHEDRYLEIGLQPLSDKQSELLIRNLLKIENLPHTTRLAIARKAEGNPFFIEEVIRSLIDQGAIEVHGARLSVTQKIESATIPSTIQDVILSRVEQLDARARQILQLGAVIGRTFYHRLLVALMDDKEDTEPVLALLRDRQVVVERQTRNTSTLRRTMLVAEREFVFKHALIQETIYESLPNRTRKELHRRVAAAIETLFADRLDDFLGMLALHYLRCDDLARAETYLFKAGEEAVRTAASSEALSYFREAYRVYCLIHGEGGDPRRRADLERNIGSALLLTGSLTESRPYFDRALMFLGEKVARSKMEAYRQLVFDALRILTRVYILRGRMSKRPSTPEMREALALLYSRAKVESVADPEWFIFDSMYMTGRLTTIDPRTIEQGFAQWAGVALLFAYSGLSFGISRRIAEVARSLMREDRPGDLVTYHLMNFMRDYFEGLWDHPSEIDDALIEQVMRGGSSFWDLDTFLGMDAYKQLDQGNFEAAAARLKKICEIADDYGYRFAETNKLAITLFTAVAQRRLDDAVVAVERYADRPEENLNLIALGNKAKIHLLMGDTEAAGVAIGAADALLARMGRTAPFHSGWYRTSKLLYSVTRLEHIPYLATRSERTGLFKSAVRDAHQAIRTASVLAMIRTETYRLVGTLYWLTGSRKEGLGWWEKSVREGERLGARPELARTYAEIGRRLASSDDAHRVVAGKTAASHLDEARRLFAEMGLAWDLARVGATDSARKVA